MWKFTFDNSCQIVTLRITFCFYAKNLYLQMTLYVFFSSQSVVMAVKFCLKQAAIHRVHFSKCSKSVVFFISRMFNVITFGMKIYCIAH